MGYNNHHVGMHMISYRRYAAYEELQYYDRIAEEKRELAKKEDKTEMKSKPLKASGKAEAIPEKPVKNAVASNISNKSEKNPKKVNNNMKNNRNENNISNELMIPHIPYGTEESIEIRYFENMELVEKNMMFIALKNKANIGEILLDVENIMKRDKRTNAEPTISNTWAWLPMLEKAMIFLSMVADRLNCNVQEFFIDNEEVCRKYIYKLLDEINEWRWIFGEVDAETGNAEIRIQGYLEATTFDSFSRSMDLIIGRQFFDDVPNYYLAYGALTIKPEMRYDYVLKGAYLLEEEEGKLKDLVERLIEKNPDWLLE